MIRRTLARWVRHVARWLDGPRIGAIEIGASCCHVVMDIDGRKVIMDSGVALDVARVLRTAAHEVQARQRVN